MICKYICLKCVINTKKKKAYLTCSDFSSLIINIIYKYSRLGLAYPTTSLRPMLWLFWELTTCLAVLSKISSCTRSCGKIKALKSCTIPEGEWNTSNRHFKSFTFSAIFINSSQRWILHFKLGIKTLKWGHFYTFFNLDLMQIVIQTRENEFELPNNFRFNVPIPILNLIWTKLLIYAKSYLDQI